MPPQQSHSLAPTQGVSPPQVQGLALGLQEYVMSALYL